MIAALSKPHVRRALLYWPTFIGAVGFVLWLTLPSWSHEALPTAAQPLGWKYPFACCSGIDCRAVSDDRITEGPAGYTVPSGEIIAMTDSRIKESPDGVFHWCTVAGKDDGRTICLFVPPRSF